MPADAMTLRIVIDAVDHATETLRRIDRQTVANLHRLSRSLLIVGGVVTGLAALSIKAAVEQRTSIDQVSFALSTLGTSWDEQKPSIENAIKAAQGFTAFSNTELMGTFLELLRGTGNVDAALRALPIAAEAAKVTGKPVREMADMIAAALTGDDGAIKALAEFGINLSNAKLNWTASLTLIAETVHEQAMNTKDSFREFTAGIQELRTVIGDQLLPLIMPLIEGITKVITKISDWVKENPQLAQALLGTIAIMGALTVIVGALIGALGLMAGAFLAVSIIGAPVLATIAAIVVAIVGLIAVGFLLWQNWDSIWKQIRDAFKSAVDFILGLYESGLGWILPGGPLVKALSFLWDHWAEIWGGIQSLFQSALDALTNLYESKLGWLLPGGPLVKALFFLRDHWEQIWSGIRDFTEATWEAIRGVAIAIWEGLREGWGATWEAIRSAAETIGGALVGGWGATWEAIRSAAETIWEGLKGGWQAVWDFLVESATKARDFLKVPINAVIGLAEGLANAWVEAANIIVRALNSIRVSIPDWVPQIGGRSFGINLSEIARVAIPRLQEGGLVTKPTLAMLGEAGPEAVIPFRGGRANMTIVVQFSGPVYGVPDLQRVIVETIRSHATRGGFNALLQGR